MRTPAWHLGSGDPGSARPAKAQSVCVRSIPPGPGPGRKSILISKNHLPTCPVLVRGKKPRRRTLVCSFPHTEQNTRNHGSRYELRTYLGPWHARARHPCHAHRACCAYLRVLVVILGTGEVCGCRCDCRVRRVPGTFFFFCFCFCFLLFLF